MRDDRTYSKDSDRVKLLHRRDFIHKVGMAAVAASVGGLGLTGSAHASQRPLADFLDAQGKYAGVFSPTPDLPDYAIGWVPATTSPPARIPPLYGAVIDYAGLADEWIVSKGGPSLGTIVDGRVSERPLNDGRAEVSVILHTMNALSWAVFLADPTIGFAFNPLLFGALAPDVVSGAEPALGEAHLLLVFKNTAPGAPLPDILDLFGIVGVPEPGQEWVSVGFDASATGPLTALAGLGPDGTPGRLVVTQRGLARIPGGGPRADFFPVERVELRKIGK